MRLIGKISALLLLLVGVGKCPAFTQQNTDWVFGDRIVLHFEADTIRLDTTSCHAQVYHEPCAAISDSNGLLLYMNHDSIYNKHHVAIASLKDSIESNFTITQGCLILPDPGYDSRYFCIYLEYYEDAALNIPCRLRYTTIEVSTTYDEFEIIEKDVKVRKGDLLTEKLVATRHSNGKDWWILTHGYGNDSIIVYSLNSSGIKHYNSLALGVDFSAHGQTVGMGEMDFSIQGDKVAWVNVDGTLDIARFDRCVGELALIAAYYLPDTALWGVSFSPNGRYLYISEAFHDFPTGCSLYQFDLEAPDIRASMIRVYRTTSDAVELYQHQIGPDGKIYICGFTSGTTNTTPLSNSRCLSVINSPDSLGAACDFQFKQVFLGTRYCWAGLPNQPNYNLGALAAQTARAGPDLTVCVLDTFDLGIDSPLQSGISAQWNTLVTGWMETPTELGTRATAAASGWFYLTVTDSALGAPCGVTMDSVWVTVQSPPVLSALADTTQCEGDSVLLTVPTQNGVSYQWTPSIGLSDPNSHTTWASPVATTTYTVTATDTSKVGSCRVASTVVTITVEDCNPEIIKWMPSYVQGDNPLLLQDMTSPVRLVIHDMRGRLIYTTSNYQGEVKGTDLSEGIYWYEVRDGEGWEGRRKLLVAW